MLIVQSIRDARGGTVQRGDFGRVDTGPTDAGFVRVFWVNRYMTTLSERVDKDVKVVGEIVRIDGGSRVIFKGQLQSPLFNAYGPAEAFLFGLVRGERKPEPALG